MKTKLTKEQRKEIAFKRFLKVQELAWKKYQEVVKPERKKYEEECKKIDEEKTK